MNDSGPLTKRELQIWSAVKRLGDTVFSAVALELEADTGLSGADFGILSRLEDLGGGELTQAALLASLEWQKSRLSHQLTRMEARGLVKRERIPGQGAVVTILPPARERIARARPVHAVAVRKHVLRHLTPHEADVLLAITGRLSAR